MRHINAAAGARPLGRSGVCRNIADWNSFRRSARLTAGAFLLLLMVCGCASMVPQTMALRDAWPAGVPPRSEIAEVPFFPQLEYQCGPAALATALVQSGVKVTPDDLAAIVYIPSRQGSLQVEMLAAPRRFGRVSYPLSGGFDNLLREVAAGNPVVVLQDTGIGPIANWHYAVVVGFDYPSGELFLRSGDIRRQALPFTVFEYTWKKSSYWAMVTMTPGRIPASADETGYLASIVAMERGGDALASAGAYRAFLDRWPANIAALIGLANNHYALGKLEDAAMVLRHALVRNPDSVVVLNNLAQVLSDLGRNDEALVLVERANLSGESPFSVTVGETYALIRQRMAGSK